MRSHSKDRVTFKVAPGANVKCRPPSHTDSGTPPAIRSPCAVSLISTKSSPAISLLRFNSEHGCTAHPDEHRIPGAVAVELLAIHSQQRNRFRFTRIRQRQLQSRERIFYLRSELICRVALVFIAGQVPRST